MYVYQLLSDRGHSYIGERLADDPNNTYMGSSYYFSRHKDEQVKKRVLLDTGDNKALTDLWESFLICADKFIFHPVDNVNGHWGGHLYKEHPTFRRGHTEASRKKMSAALIGHKANFSAEHREFLRQKTIERNKAGKGKKLSPEHVAAIVAGLTGRECTAETRARRSASLKGKPSWLKGKHLSSAHRQAISTANKGYVVPIQTRLAVSKANKGNQYAVGMKPWNNGEVNTRSVACPGEGWVYGYLRRKEV